MSVPKGKRKQSRFEAHHNFFKLRDEVTILMLMDFGFSEEKYNDRIEKYRQLAIIGHSIFTQSADGNRKQSNA